jgi:hypothetical protein
MRRVRKLAGGAILKRDMMEKNTDPMICPNNHFGVKKEADGARSFRRDCRIETLCFCSALTGHPFLQKLENSGLPGMSSGYSSSQPYLTS